MEALSSRRTKSGSRKKRDGTRVRDESPQQMRRHHRLSTRNAMAPHEVRSSLLATNPDCQTHHDPPLQRSAPSPCAEY